MSLQKTFPLFPPLSQRLVSDRLFDIVSKNNSDQLKNVNNIYPDMLSKLNKTINFLVRQFFNMYDIRCLLRKSFKSKHENSNKNSALREINVGCYPKMYFLILLRLLFLSFLDRGSNEL